MTSLSRCLEEAAFSISISSCVFIFLWLFSRCIMDIVSSIVYISCTSLRSCSENLDLPSAYETANFLSRLACIASPVR